MKPVLTSYEVNKTDAVKGGEEELGWRSYLASFPAGISNFFPPIITLHATKILIKLFFLYNLWTGLYIYTFEVIICVSEADVEVLTFVFIAKKK